MDALYLAGHLSRNGRRPPRKAASDDAFYEQYSPRNLRELLPFVSAIGAVGAWLVVLALIPG